MSVGLLVVASVQAADQSKAPEKTDPNQAPSASVAISASEVIPRAEQTLRTLQETRFQLAAESDAALNALQSEITAYAEKSYRRWRDEVETIRGLRSFPRLNDILREWSLEQSQLDGWDRVLSRRSQILVAQENDIARIHDTWRTTREAAKQQTYPKVALAKIADVMREADAVRGLIRDSMAKLLGLQIQLATRRDILATVRGDIDQAREASGRQLFVLDSPPLWRALHPQSKDELLLPVLRSLQRFAVELEDFFSRFSERILWHIGLFLLLLGLFHFGRRGWSREAVERLGGASALLIFERMYAASFLLAFLAVPLFYSAATGAVLRSALILTVIPLIRLLAPLLSGIYRHPLHLLLTLYVLEYLRYVMPSEWLLTRLLLLGIGAGGAIDVLLFLRLRGAELAASPSKKRLIAPALRLIAFLFAVSVISNVAGNVSLAEILVGLPIRISYIAALVYAGAHLLLTLIALMLQSSPALWFRSVREHGELIASRAKTSVRVGAFLVWATFSLYAAGVLGSLSAAIGSFFQLRWKVGAAEISVEGVAIFFAVFFSAVIFSRLLRFVLTEEVLPRIHLARGVPGAVDVLSRYGILLLGFFIALAAAGADFTKVTLLISALGVGIGFGLQNLVNNFVSGLILVFEHPIQVGDYVEVGTLFGEVRGIGFRASIVRTPDGADVIVPNSELIGSRVLNWSLSDRLRRINIPVSVAYGTDPNQVIDLLVGVARKHPAILLQPPPLAVFDRFADSSLNFTLLCWTDVERFFLARSELTVAINDAFREAAIQIPFPQQDVHVHLPDGVAPRRRTIRTVKRSRDGEECGGCQTISSEVAREAGRSCQPVAK